MTLATVPGDGKGLALDQGMVFFTSSTQTSSALLAVDTTGTLRTIATDAVNVSLLGADGGTVVWSTGIDAHLYAAPSLTAAAGGSSADLGVSLADYQGSYDAPLLGVSTGYVLWSDGKVGLGAFWSLPVTGGTPSSHALGGPVASAIAAGGSILWKPSATIAMIGAVPDAAGAAMIPNAVGPIVGYRSGTAYFLADPALEMIRINAFDVATDQERVLDSTVVMAAASCPSPGKWGLSTLLVGLDEALYASEFTDCASDEKEHLSVIRSQAGSVTEVAAYTSTYQAGAPLAVDASCLYWVESDGTNASLKTIAR